jgi:hypothetical protein
MSVYLCSPLLKVFQSKKPVKICIAGRGTGKSTALGLEFRQAAAEMPGSLGTLGGPTYNQLLTKMLPSAKKMLIASGLKEDRPGDPGHFVIGKKPPPHFRTPINAPLKYEYVITMFNGSALELVSQDRPDAARGGSYDYKLYDEAVLMKKEFHDEVDIFTLRGNDHIFGNSPRHGMRVYMSSQAHSSLGYWVEDQKYLKDDNGDILYDPDGEPRLDPDVIAVTATSYDNIKILGEKTIRMWKKTASPTAWDIEVMSKRGGKLPNGFYPGFNPKAHTYMGGFEYDYDDKSEYGIYVKRQDVDRNPKLPLILSADFNAVQNTLVVAQEQDDTLRFLNEFYAAGNRSSYEWLDPFLEYYSNHQEKVIFLYGDPGGNKKASMEQMSSFEKMIEVLVDGGWDVRLMVKGKSYPGHRERHYFIDDMLKGKRERLPSIQIHYTRCRWLISSIENAPILPDFRKNKKSENQDIDQRLATHGSDAFDYLVFYRYYQGGKASAPRKRVRFGSRTM